MAEDIEWSVLTEALEKGLEGDYHTIALRNLLYAKGVLTNDELDNHLEEDVKSRMRADGNPGASLNVLLEYLKARTD